MIAFNKKELCATFTDAEGNQLERLQQIRTDPITLRQSRITLSRALENERGSERLYQPPDFDLDESKCPFCLENRDTRTPCLDLQLFGERRMTFNKSVLFPNLFPYTEWSAISLFDDLHFVEIGKASTASYRDCLINCSEYLTRVKKADPEAVFMSITQNHLPGAGGSLVHPHLQVHATRQATNNHRTLKQRALEYFAKHQTCILSDLLDAEITKDERYIGRTGIWQWTAAFAPSGFYEIWGIASSEYSLLIPDRTQVWQDLAEGISNTQKFYRSLNRNSYNLSILSIEDEKTIPCLKIALAARSSYAPWVRSDITGYEFASGEMATFTYPESTAAKARKYW